MNIHRTIYCVYSLYIVVFKYSGEFKGGGRPEGAWAYPAIVILLVICMLTLSLRPLVAASHLKHIS